MTDDHDHESVAVRATLALRLAQLVEEIGRPAAVVMAGRAFLDNLDTSVASITEAPDATARDRGAHALAGSAETLGATALGATCREIMQLAREQPDEPLAAELTDRLRADASRAASALTAELAELEDA